MKKSVLLLAALMFTATFSSCLKDKEGEYKPKEQISRVFRDYGEGDGKELKEVWNWDKKMLTSIDHYSDGYLSWTEDFTYNKKNQLERVDCYADRETVEYLYDGNKLNKSTYYYKGSIEEEYTFKYDGNKISEIEIFYMDKSKGEKRLLNEGHNPIKMMLDENSYQEVNKFIAKKEASRYIITMKLEWEKNNVSKMTLEAGTERLVFDFKHDDKINPYKNFFDLYTFYSEEWNDVELSFSKNNVTETRATYTDEGESETEITKYSYTYDGKVPTVQRATYTEQYYDYWEDEYYTETYTVSTYYEYE